MSYIGIGLINRNLIPIFLGCIFCFLNRILNQYKDTLLFQNPILTNIFISISHIFTFIPYIIFTIRTKPLIDNDNKIKFTKTDKKFAFIYTNIDLKIVKGKVKYIIFSSLLYFITSIIFVYTFEIKTNSGNLFIFAATVFYYYIFKIKLYKHHYLSIIIILLMGLIIDLVFENLQNEIIHNFVLLVLSCLRIVLLSFYYVIVKYIMEKKFASVYEITFFNGLINFVLMIILAIIDYYFIQIFEYKEYFYSFDIKELLIVLGVMVTQLGIYICIVISSKFFSPCHAFIIFVFGHLAYYLYNFELTVRSMIAIICIFIIIFFSLVFNEIIEINCWQLSYNLKRNITNRSESESDKSLIMKSETIESENLIELGEAINDD